MDETERQALQEAEDERFAREILEKEKQKIALVRGQKCILFLNSPFDYFVSETHFQFPYTRTCTDVTE